MRDTGTKGRKKRSSPKSSQKHMEEAGFTHLGEVKPPGRCNGFQRFEALLCKRKARFVTWSPRSKKARKRDGIHREGILALYKGEILTLELSQKWNGLIPGTVQTSGKGVKDLTSRLTTSWGPSQFQNSLSAHNVNGDLVNYHKEWLISHLSKHHF